MKKYDVVVVGAGMVGISCALWLQKSGRSVCLVDRNAPGASTASGSACTFADYACIPINAPSLPLKVPGMLLRKNSPLAVKWNYIYRMVPWLGQFLAHCRPKQVAHIIDALGVILSHAESGLMPLIEDAGAMDLIQHRGCLYLYNTASGYQAAGPDIRARRERGVSLREIEPADIYDLEPGLEKVFHKGVFFDKAFQFLFPGKLIERFLEHFVAQGGTFLSDNVQSIDQIDPESVAIRCETAEISAQKVVVAAGAHAGKLLPSGAGKAHLGKIPLETERGYHLMLKANETVLNRPVGWAEKGFYMTPLAEQIRIAGTVELGGLQENYTTHLLDYMENTAREVLPALGPRENAWLGFRPSMPDALPVIGTSPQHPNIVMAFGHQHIGLTLGGITGKVVSSLVAGKDPDFDLSPYSPQRFLSS